MLFERQLRRVVSHVCVPPKTLIMSRTPTAHMRAPVSAAVYLLQTSTCFVEQHPSFFSCGISCEFSLFSSIYDVLKVFKTESDMINAISKLFFLIMLLVDRREIERGEFPKFN